MAMDESLRADLVALSRAIHDEPELAYQEHKAVANISALLQKYGHAVERPYGGLETAFRSRIGPSCQLATSALGPEKSRPALPCAAHPW